MIMNNSFSLFTSHKEGVTAAADDILLIFPYIIVKAQVKNLLRHIKFIKTFEYQELMSGEKSYVLNKLDISIKIIMEFDKEKRGKSEIK